jgi:D-beta-D-heptose 7-phosphate kinase / D-beta-D-heptose 1-phosphate adenosyltransferase
MKIIGDVMLDIWVQGDCTKVSPEASALVLKEYTRNHNVGGAGNLALNLSNLGADTHLYGSVGNDAPGHKIQEILLENSIKTYLCQDGSATTTKTRMIGPDGQHLLRLDKEEEYTRDTPQETLLKNLQNNDIVIISDYNKGVVKEHLVRRIQDKVKRIYVDPKQDPNIYYGSYLIKPNMKEYENWFGKFDPHTADIKRIHHNWQWLIVTDGANGIHVVGENIYKHITGDAVELADVSGAGDTVLAIIVYYHEQGSSMIDACEKALKGASRVVQHRGVTVVKKTDIEDRIVWTNGVFDILHKGHLELLKFAKLQGDKLIVGINSDASVKRLKGNDRPLNNTLIREQQLLQLPWVDKVVVFDEDTPLEAIKIHQPNVIVKGGDYTIETTVGNDMAEVVIFPTVQGFSTTNILEKFKNGN